MNKMLAASSKGNHSLNLQNQSDLESSKSYLWYIGSKELNFHKGNTSICLGLPGIGRDDMEYPIQDGIIENKYLNELTLLMTNLFTEIKKHTNDSISIINQ